MMDEVRVGELLLRWQESRRQGRDISAEELCVNCPELTPELKRQIAIMTPAPDRQEDATLLPDTPVSKAPSSDVAAPPSGYVSAPPTVAPATASEKGPSVQSGSGPAPSSASTGDSKTGAAGNIPGYVILGVLGRGGMGVVYKARQIKLGRTVALKMILAGGHAGPQDLARFRTEGEAVASLQHPNIVQIFEVGEHEGRPFLSFEYVDGGNLDDKLAGEPLAAGEAARLIEAVAGGIHAAHRHGIVHRDLKPANILLTADGQPKITDFGLAKRLGVDTGQTQSGALLGTPSYMSPEQADGKIREIGPLADVYALGAILYELLTGRPPFKAETPTGTMHQVVCDEPVALTKLRPDVPRDLETICLKCLQKAPANRYSSALELADELRRFQAGEAIRARPAGRMERAWKWVKRRPAVSALLAVSVLAVLLVAQFVKSWMDAPPKDLAASVSAQVTEYLKARNPQAAQDYVKRYEESLPDKGDMLYAKIEDKKVVLDVLTRAQANLAEKRYADCLANIKSLDAWKAKLDPDDLGESKTLFESALNNLLEENLGARNFPAARDLVKQNETFFAGRAEAIQARIDAKKSFLDAITLARKSLQEKKYGESLAGVSAIQGDLDNADRAEKDLVFAQARKGWLETEAVQLEAFFKAKQYPMLRKLLEDPNIEKLSDVGRYPQRVLSNLLAEAWQAVATDNLAEARQRLKELDEFVGQMPRIASIDNAFNDPRTQGEITALRALETAYRPEKATRDPAVKALLVMAGRKDMRLDLQRKLWDGLARLDRSKRLFTIADVETLEHAFSTSSVAEVHTANAQILAGVLRRLIEKTKWLPDPPQRAEVLTWIGRIDRPSDWVRALRTECLLESDPAKADAVDTFADADWYGAYVHALALAQKGESRTAAALLFTTLKETPDALEGQKIRSEKAVSLFRAAVGRLDRTEDKKTFKSTTDAQDASRWLTLAFTLLKDAGQQPSLDDLVSLAFAGAKNPSHVGNLTAVGRDLDAGKFDKADAKTKAEGFYWLAKAYLAKGNSEKEYLTYLDKVAAIEAPAKGDWSKRAATDAAEHMLKMAKNALKSGTPQNKLWDRATEQARKSLVYARTLTDMDLEKSAEIYRDAVDVELQAVLRQSASSDWSAKGLLIDAVFNQALPKDKIGPPHVGVIIQKLEWASVLPRERREPTVNEGNTALKLAEAETQKPGRNRRWWQERECVCMVKLADLRHALLEDRLDKASQEKDAKTKERELQTLGQESAAIVGLYEKARSMKLYAEQWQELAFKIGNGHLELAARQHQLGNAATARKELSIARRELQDSLQDLKRAPKGTEETVRGALSYIDDLSKKLDRK